MNKLKIISYLLAPITVATPLASIVSCSNITFTDTTYTEQNALISSQGSKNLLSATWAKRTFANFYIQQVLNQSVTKAKSDAIVDFLSHLNISAANQEVLTKADYEAIYQLAYDAFKSYSAFNYEKDNNFFVNKFSTLSSDTELNGWSDIAVWKWDEKTSKLVLSTETIGEYFFKNGIDGTSYYYDTRVSNGVSNTWNNKFEKSFKTLYWSQKTGIQKTILEMMLTYLYFSKSNENFVKGGSEYLKKYNGDSGSISSLEAWEMSNFDVNSKTYFFENYLVTNSPVLKWSFKSTDSERLKIIPQDLRTNGVYNKKDLNNLVNSIGQMEWKTLNANLVIDTSDKILNQIIKEENNSLEGFDYTSMSSGIDSPIGDLDFNRLNLVNFVGEKSGFLDSFSSNEYRKSNLISFDQLDAMKALRIGNYSLPSISIESPKYAAQEIKADNIKITKFNKDPKKPIWKLDPSQQTNANGLPNTIELKNIIPDLNISSDASQKNKVKLLFVATFSPTTPTTKSIKYEFDVEIKWNLNDQPNDIESDLKNEIKFNNLTKSEKYSLNGITVDNAATFIDSPTEAGLTYFTRLLPIFKWNSENATITIDKKLYPKGIFTLEGTTLANPETIKKLSYYFYLQDSNLFNNSVKRAFVWNGYNLSSADSTVSSVLEELKLKPLTSSERQDKKLANPFFDSSAFNSDAIISREEQLVSLNNERRK